MKTILVSLLFACVSSVSLAQNARLSDASYLRKLSFHIKGVPPTPGEYTDLAAASRSGKADAFFAQKISEYQASQLSQAKMGIRLQELFKLTTASSLPTASTQPGVPWSPSEWDDSLDDLFLRLTRENLSWDELLTGKSYRLFPSNYHFQTDDFSFVRAVIPQIVPPVDTGRGSSSSPTPSPINYSFAPTDERIAGALTTSRFFGRYTTTELNKNRRRAAAVFNLFLCDSMSAAIPDPPASPDSGLNKAFPDTSTLTPSEIAAVTNGPDKHGADQACAKCHYKLDPAGQAFMMSAYRLAPVESPGRLVFKDDRTGQLVNEPVTSLGGLGKAITEQPQYLRCQVRRFWNWFIGTDRPLTDNRVDELAAEFDRVGRKTNDIVKIMVTAPEFRTRDFRSEAEIRADQVSAVLQNCTSCHDSSKIPDFTKWPIGGTPASMKDWSARIYEQLDFAHDGSPGAKMPPAWSAWKPTAAELKLLKNWIDDKAPDAQGRPQL